jgi:carbohydrate-binding DOMON domain-containing protein
MGSPRGNPSVGKCAFKASRVGRGGDRTLIWGGEDERWRGGSVSDAQEVVGGTAQR